MWETSVINSNYEVNELGQVRNKQTKNVLKGYLDKDGYRIYTLRKDGKQKSIKAHILIASNFCIKQSQENEVNHIDFNKENNCASNLEWLRIAKIRNIGEKINLFIQPMNQKGKKTQKEHQAFLLLNIL